MDDDLNFWTEYISLARQGYLASIAFDRSGDPLRTALDEWFQKIDEAMAEAGRRGFERISVRWRFGRGHPELVWTFSDGRTGGQRFQRSMRLDGRFKCRHLLSKGQMVDFKVALQSLILNERASGILTPGESTGLG
jgi:hypothetical protein